MTSRDVLRVLRMRELLFRAALLRFAGPVPVSLKWAEVTDPTLRGRLSLPWPVGAGFSPGPLGDSLLAVKSPRPLPGQTETMSPDSRKPGGLPRPTSPAHRTGFFQHLPGANCGPAVQGLKWRSCSQVLTRLLPGSPRSLIFPTLDGSDHEVILEYCWENVPFFGPFYAYFV